MTTKRRTTKKTATAPRASTDPEVASRGAGESVGGTLTDEGGRPVTDDGGRILTVDGPPPADYEQAEGAGDA